MNVVVNQMTRIYERLFLAIIILTDCSKWVCAQLLLPTTTSNCPLICPSGWVTIPLSGGNHCYLFPQAPIPVNSFWNLQARCASLYSTSNKIVISSEQENTAVILYISQYAPQFVQGSFYIYEGAYHENGEWKTVTGEPFYSGAHLKTDPANPPTNGSCVYWNPKSLSTTMQWYYRPCSDNNGAGGCEMLPIADCAATITTTGPYAAPECFNGLMADFAMQQQRGYLAVQELLLLTGMDFVSCAVACMYYSGCYSFDISTAGECRLIGDNAIYDCNGSLQPDDSYTHYDLISFPTAF